MQRTARFSLFTFVFTAASAWGGIVYSGPQNIVIQAVAGGGAATSINLAGGLSSADTISLRVDASGGPQGAIQLAAGLSSVVAATGYDLIVKHLALGQSYPAGAAFALGVPAGR